MSVPTVPNVAASVPPQLNEPCRSWRPIWVIPIAHRNDPGVDTGQVWVAAVGATGALTTLYITPGTMTD